MPACVRVFCEGSVCAEACVYVWALTGITPPDSGDSHPLVHINPVVHTHTCATQLWLMLTSSQEPSGLYIYQREATICSFTASSSLSSVFPADRAWVDHHLHHPLLLLLLLLPLHCFVPVSPSLQHLPPPLLGQVPFSTWFCGLQFCSLQSLLTVSWPSRTHLFDPLFILTSSPYTFFFVMRTHFWVNLIKLWSLCFFFLMSSLILVKLQNTLPDCLSWHSGLIRLIESAFCAVLAQRRELFKVCFTHMKDFFWHLSSQYGCFVMLPIQIGEWSSRWATERE